jgi:hypothetical protein
MTPQDKARAEDNTPQSYTTDDGIPMHKVDCYQFVNANYRGFVKPCTNSIRGDLLSWVKS